MKGKKLLSTVMAGALAVTMTVPAMAADGGEIDVDVTTKTAVIRVEVPTTMAIAVDQFMMADAGTQISSSEFTMANKSAVDVKVEVTSTATLAATTKLMATKAAAKDSTKAGDAWLGVAAQTAAGDYDDPTTDTSDPDADTPVADTPETIATLTEANANVATFAAGDTATEGKAVQTFYLQKGAGAVAYTMLNANEDASEITYAQFYELTAETVADQDALDALIEANDVYVATAAADDGQTLTLVEKGGSHTKGASDVYYTAADTATAKASLDASKLYVYGGTANADADGNAAFRYIGVLSGGQETWSDSDISAIKIKYNIVGVTADKYTEVAEDCHYGLYSEANQNVVESDGTNDIVIYYKGAKPASVTITPASTNAGTNKTALTKSNGTEVTIDEEKVTLTKEFISAVIKNSARGKGTYTVTIGTTDTTVTFK